MKGATWINIDEYNQQNIKKEKSMQNDRNRILVSIWRRGKNNSPKEYSALNFD